MRCRVLSFWCLRIQNELTSVYKTNVLVKLLRQVKMVNFYSGNSSNPFFNYLVSLIFLGILLFLLAFISKRKHLLATLLRLEGLILMIFALLYYSSTELVSFQGFMLVFLTVAACEGALGLSLLVVMVRNHGGDRFNSFNFLQC